MNILAIVNSVVVSVGIPFIIMALMSAGRKLQKIDDIDRQIQNKIEPHLGHIDNKISSLGERVAAVEGKVDLLFKIKPI